MLSDQEADVLGNFVRLNTTRMIAGLLRNAAAKMAGFPHITAERALNEVADAVDRGATDGVLAIVATSKRQLAEAKAGAAALMAPKGNHNDNDHPRGRAG